MESKPGFEERFSFFVENRFPFWRNCFPGLECDGDASHIFPGLPWRLDEAVKVSKSRPGGLSAQALG